MRKVKITRLPKALYGLNFHSPSTSHPSYSGAQHAPGLFHPSDNGSKPDIEVNNTLKPTSPENANLEAEKGETVVTNLSESGIPELYTVGGKRHYNGGTPLNLPNDSFIFSRDNALKITDPKTLELYNKTSKKGKRGYLPAEISKQYKLNDFQQVLLDPDTDRIEKETAEQMIRNYNLKLGSLALIQESMKGFPDGIPGIATPYLEHIGVDPVQLMEPPKLNKPPQGATAQEGGESQAGRQYLLNRRGNPVNYRYVQYAQNPDIPPVGEDVAYQAYYSKPVGDKTKFNSFTFDAKENSAMYPEMSPAGGYNAVLVPEGEEDPYATKMKGSQYARDERIKKKFYDRSRFQGGGGTDVLNVDPSQYVSPSATEGNMVRFNPTEGTYEIVNRRGKTMARLVPGQGYMPVEGGGAPETSTKTTRAQNIPEGVTKWDESTKGYDETQIQAGDYIKKADNNWHKVTGHSIKENPYTGGYTNPNLKGEFGDLQQSFGRLQQTFAENTDLRNAVVAKYREEISKATPNTKTGLTQEDIDTAKNMPDEQVISNFLNMQEQVLAVNANMGNMSDADAQDRWDQSKANYTDTAMKLGFTPLNTAQTAAFQGTYIALQNIADDPQFKQALSEYKVVQKGLGDEPGGGTGRGTISNIDGWVGNDTIAQAVIYEPSAKELVSEEAEWEETETKDVKHLPPPPVPEDAPWWLQDIVKTAGAARDFWGVKKYSPWQATPGTKLATPTFMDPTRGLAANAELANIGTQAAASFAGPQSFNARFAQIQGKAAQNAANVLAGTHNQNVNIANQFELTNTNIMNKASRERAQLSTNLYDKNVIANQQFDNAKNMARQELRQSYIDGISNRAQAQTLNQLYDQYSVDPSTGGFMDFTQDRPITPKEKKQPSVMDLAAEYKKLNPGWSDSSYIQAAKGDMGLPSRAPGAGFGIDPAEFGYPPAAGQ